MGNVYPALRENICRNGYHRVFMVVRGWKHASCSSQWKHLSKMQYMHTMRFYVTGIDRNKNLTQNNRGRSLKEC